MYLYVIYCPSYLGPWGDLTTVKPPAIINHWRYAKIDGLFQFSSWKVPWTNWWVEATPILVLMSIYSHVTWCLQGSNGLLFRNVSGMFPHMVGSGPFSKSWRYPQLSIECHGDLGFHDPPDFISSHILQSSSPPIGGRPNAGSSLAEALLVRDVGRNVSLCSDQWWVTGFNFKKTCPFRLMEHLKYMFYKWLGILKWHVF